MLSVLGGVLGLVLAVAGLNLLIAYAGRFTNRTGEIAVDGWVLGFTMIVAIAIAMLFAWAPRLTFVNDPARAMAGAAGRTAGSPGRRRAQRLLVVSQLAASFMLLIGAGLLTRTLLQLYAVDPGFDLANVLSLQAPGLHRAEPRQTAAVQQDVLDRVKGQSSVQAAAMASSAPLGGSMAMPRDIKVDGADADAAQRRRWSSPASSARTTSRRSARALMAGRPLPGDRPPDVAAGRDSQPVDGPVLLQGSESHWPAIGRWKLFNGNWSPRG